MNYDKMMVERKSEDNQYENIQCRNERRKGTFVFPAIEIAIEIEKSEGTTCIDTNRDELLKSFCSFTSDLDSLFENQGFKKKRAKWFWPNICCKERNDDKLETCQPPGGRVKRKDIIPFALSQGGNYSRHNL